MNFADVMSREGSVKSTENGAYAYNTAGQGALLDFFSQAGALRPRSENEIANKFAAAYQENALLATKALFYTGDIRQGGLGERRTFRICLKWMAENHPDVVIKNLDLIPYFNRFDSWFELVGTSCERKMWERAAEVLTEDLKAYKTGATTPVSLLAKWMPSENTSSWDTRRMAKQAMSIMRLRPREYRKMLSKLRKRINIVEAAMSAGRWSEIDYSKVPSYAMHNYGSAFAKHDYERFNAYLQSVKKGEVKINAATLFPYDLVHKYGCSYNRENPVVEAQWKALPNYLTSPVNAVVMADVSYSMHGQPMETSVGLAIYFAQHNQGAYHNKYMTFTSHPSFINIKEGASLAENINQVKSTDVGYSTNLNAAFDAILDSAVAYHVPKNEMPKALIVISDMEIDKYMRPGSRWDFIQTQKAKFNRHGYELPKMVMWNVSAREDTYLSQNEDVIFLSGQSAATFRHLCQNLNGVTAYQMMLKVLNGKAYAEVKV